MSLFPCQTAGLPAPLPIVSFRDAEDAYIVSWITHLSDFTSGYVDSLIRYLNPCNKISNVGLFAYIHRRTRAIAMYHPQPVKAGWRVGVPLKGAMAYFAYWVAREPVKGKKDAAESDSESKTNTIEPRQEHPPNSILSRVPNYAKNDPMPRFWCNHCCWSGSFAARAVTVAKHSRGCHPGRSFQWQTVVYVQSRHAKTAAQMDWEESAGDATGTQKMKPEERLCEAMSML